jgi:hypothetical protein
VSKVNDIKNLKRQQRVVTPTQALVEAVGEEENNVSSNKEINKKTKEENKIERKRVSFDLRTDLYKALKMEAIIQEKNMYIIIEEALEKYLKENK